jgi:hypothetical protein
MKALPVVQSRHEARPLLQRKNAAAQYVGGKGISQKQTQGWKR